MTQPSPKKALIVRNGHLGDIVMSACVIDPLKAAGFTQIDWLSNGRILDLLPWMPDCRKGYLWNSGKSIFAQFGLLKNLRKERYDVCVILEASSQYYPLVWLAGARSYVSLCKYRYLTLGIDSVWRWAPHVSDVKNYNELIGRYLHAPSNAMPKLYPPQARGSTRLQQWFAQANAAAIQLVIHPGASLTSVRAYPFAQYRDLIGMLLREQELVQITISGTGKELLPFKELLEEYPEKMRLFFEDATLDELCRLIHFSNLFVSADTGPMHIADALGKHQLVLCGPTNPVHTGPSGNNACVLCATYPCAPCIYNPDQSEQKICQGLGFARCFKSLPPEKVLAEIRKRWGNENTLLRKEKLL